MKVLIILLVIILSLVVMSVSLSDDIPKTEVKYLDVKSLKTGDVLVVSYHGVRTLFSSIFYRSKWTHVGIVVIDQTGEVFILEAADYRPPYSGDILKVPLSYWSKVNQNVAAIGLVRINKEVNREELEKSFARYQNGEYAVEDLHLTWVRFLWNKTRKSVSKFSCFASDDRKIKRNWKVYKDTSISTSLKRALGNENISDSSFKYLLTCHEIIIDCYQDLGILKDERTPCSFFPSIFTQSKFIPTKNGFSFGEVELVSVSHLFDRQGIW